MKVLEDRGVRVVAVSDDVKQQWDSYVSNQETGNLLQAWGWGELRRQYGWQVFRLAALRGPEEEWAGAIQVLHQGIGPGGFGWGYSPQGPVLSSLGDVEAGRALLQAAARRLRLQKAFQLKCDPEWPVDSSAAQVLRARCGLRPARFDVQHRQTWLVDLRGGVEALSARIPSATKYCLRVSEREGVVVTAERTSEAVATFYSLHMDTVGRKQLHLRPLSYYQAAAEELGATIFIASYQGQPLAGGLTVAFGRRLVHLFGGTSTAVPRAHASYAMQWAMMQWGIAQGCEIYDMWGVPRRFDRANPAHGYAKFKTKWSGQIATYSGLMIAPVLGPLDPVLHGLEALLLRRRPLLR
ncbi:MAG TPA: peptidoglycan bridge formation glycyltransferase FemA/FemB family protein [Candidatus Acidoferrales bacterium]|nr:peptidoglycan bridge formation glycyltransferase FemA/FemB family protein [Candidatus Acidoferrales bacterium]